MEIIQIPHPSLRKTAHPVQGVDKKLISFVAELEKTLKNARNPQGVGLAAPQVDKLWRLFTIRLDKPLTIINPVITKHAKKQTFHEQEDGAPSLEGCLSMPKLWGPVPRWEWVELEFEELRNNKLVKRSKKFSDIEGRVIQHEYDHLEGILFTDYSLEYDLPVYQEQGKRFREVDPEFLELI